MAKTDHDPTTARPVRIDGTVPIVLLWPIVLLRTTDCFGTMPGTTTIGWNVESRKLRTASATPSNQMIALHFRLGRHYKWENAPTLGYFKILINIYSVICAEQHRLHKVGVTRFGNGRPGLGRVLIGSFAGDDIDLLPLGSN